MIMIIYEGFGEYEFFLISFMMMKVGVYDGIF